MTIEKTKQKGNRPMHKFDNNLISIVTKILQNNHVPMLLGEPGIGKSSWVEALGNSMHTKVFVLACNQLADKADMTGSRLMPVGETKKVNPDGSESTEIDYAQKFFPHVVIKKAIDYAASHPTEFPILFMDELNRTTADVTSEALSIPTLRSIGDVDLPKNLRIITAGNDKGNITSLDEASRSRFVLLHVEPDVETFINVNPELNIFVKNVITHHPEAIFGKALPASLSGATVKKDDDDDDQTYNIDDIFDDTDEMSQITTPRTITAVSDWLNSCKTQELNLFIAQNILDEDGNPITMLQEILEAHTGKTMFTTLLLQEIIANINTINPQQSKIKVPKPSCYDTLVNMPTRQDMQKFIGNLNDSDKGGCLIYALSEEENNAELIDMLAKQITKLEKAENQHLGTLFGSNAITDENMDAFLNAGTPITDMWKSMFGN